jgi:CHASE3 domain sensor protein
MDIAKDIIEKYSVEQIVDYLDKLSTGVLKNYQTAIKVNQSAILFGNLGDIAQIRAVLHEMNKQNQERAARARANQKS